MLYTLKSIFLDFSLLLSLRLVQFQNFSIKAYKIIWESFYQKFYNFIFFMYSCFSLVHLDKTAEGANKKPESNLSVVMFTITSYINHIKSLLPLNFSFNYSINLDKSKRGFLVYKFNNLNKLNFFQLVNYIWFSVKTSTFYLSVRFLLFSYIDYTKTYIYSFFLPRLLLPLLLAMSFFIFACITYRITLLRVFGSWLLVLFFAYWLFSGFNHFLKRYKFASFTSAIQRFWKRAYVCFWMIEGFMFFLFFYYTLNTSQEPVFMFDQVWPLTKQIWPVKSYMLTFSLIVCCILLLNVLTLQLKFNTIRQTVLTLLISTLIFVYFLFGESYQFYYIVNFYDDCVFVFSPDEKVWELESDSPRTRTRNSYYTLTILARFWHYIFIFVGWVFFITKVIESRRIRYTFLSFNTQNFILFYILAWLSMSNWLKWLFRRFMDTPYYWFINDYRQPYFKILKSISETYTHSVLKTFKTYLCPYIMISPNYSKSYTYTMFSPFSYGRGTYLEYYLSQYM